jgi:hypothetical protein
MGRLNGVLSVDEIIAVINHSNSKSILIEGREDLIFFRKLEDEFSTVGVSILPVGGRKAVLDIFDRKEEITDPESVIFFVDKDMWVYSQSPEKYQHDSLKTTFGYSIENDLYSDGNLEGLLSAAEATEFKSNLERFSHWYALAVHRVMNGDGEQTIADHPKSVISPDDQFQKKCKLAEAEAHPAEMVAKITNKYKKLMRGKSLLELILMQLSAKNRTPKHSRAALMEIGVLANGNLMGQVRVWVQERFCITQ